MSENPKPIRWQTAKRYLGPILFVLRPPLAYGLRSLVVAAWWVVLILGVLSLLKWYGFKGWSIADVVQIATAWPSAIGITLIVILLLLLRPLSDLLDRTSQAEGEGYRWSVKFRDPRETTLQRSQAIVVDSIVTSGEVYEPTVTTEPPKPASETEDESPPTDSPSGQATREPKNPERYYRRIGAADFVGYLYEVPEIKPFHSGELEHALDILRRNNLDSYTFVGRLCGDREMSAFLASHISHRTKRPVEKSIDPVSLCSWGSLLVTSNMSEEAMNQVVREIAAASKNGVLT